MRFGYSVGLISFWTLATALIQASLVRLFAVATSSVILVYCELLSLKVVSFFVGIVGGVVVCAQIFCLNRLGFNLIEGLINRFPSQLSWICYIIVVNHSRLLIARAKIECNAKAKIGYVDPLK